MQSLEKFIALFGKRLVTFILVKQSKFPSITKNKQQRQYGMVLQDALSTVDVAKQFYKVVRCENNSYIFYDKTVTTAEQHNIDLPELPHYLRLKIKNGS